MKSVMVVVFDSRAELFSQPIFMQSIGQACRSFEDAVNDGTSAYAKHPGDYTLFHAGEYDDCKGSIKMLPTLVNLGVGVTFVSAPVRGPLLSKGELE